MSSRNRWFNRLSKRSAVVLAAASAASSFSSSLWAVTGTYTVNGGSNWATNANWLFGNPYPNAVGEIANFTAIDLAPISPLVVPITLNDNITVGSIFFSDTNNATPGGWLLTPSGSSTLTLATGSSAQPQIDVGNLGNNAAVSYTEIAASIYGTNGFNKTGAGLLRLSGNNTGTTALGGNPLGLTGSLTINNGTLEVSSTLNLGNTDSTITLAGGNLSLRSDATLSLANRHLVVTANSGLNVDRSVTNTSLTNRIHQIGTVTMGSGPRILDIRGSNFYGVNIGTLILGVGNTLAIVNELAPGELTIGTVLSNVTSATNLTLGGTNNATTGANITITGAIVQQTTAGTLSLTYSDNHTVQIGSLTSVTGSLNINGNGTVIISSGKLPTNTLTVAAGTLDFSASGQASTVANLVMGTATNNQAGGAYLNSGAGTLAVIGTVTHQVAGNANQRLGQGAIIDGNLDFGSLAHSLNIGGIASLTSGGTPDMRVNAAVSGTGTLTKIGTGEILFTGANTLASAIDMTTGTLSAAARATGNALTSGAVTISGGTLRLNNLGATPGSGSIGALSFDGGATNPARLVVDSGTSGAATTLKIGTFNGRAPGTTGALTIIPRNGGLNTTEIISADAFGSAVGTGANHGILAPFVAAQQSATNSSVDFLTVSGGNIVGGAAVYVGGNIGDAPTNSVYSTTSAQTLGGAKQLFAIKADGTLADIGGGGVLTLGDGTLAGLILNNGAKVTASSLVINGPEAIFWAGGRIIDNDGTTVLAAGGTISSNISFSNPAGGLTTSGAETLTIAGQFDMGGQSRQVLTANGTAVFSGALTNGNFTKTGPGYALLTNTNTGYNGTLLSSSGTLQVGQGSLTPAAGIGATSVVNVGNGNVVLALDGPKNLGNFITSTGTGNLIVDSPTSVINFTNATSNFARLTIQSGNVQLTNDNQLPQGATLTVQGSGSFDMNGRSQTVAALAGATGGTITNNGAGLSTLTVNIGSGSSTYNSVITNGTGIAVNKNGAGTQIFTGASNYAGGTKLNLGTLQLQNNTAAGVGSIQFFNNGGALAISGNVTAPNPISIGNISATIGVVNNGSNGTLNGAITVGSTGTLNVVWGGTGASLNVPNLSSANFTGTLAFAGNGGTFRIVSGATAGSAYNLSAATFNFGSSTTTFGFNQGSVTVTMPFIVGGTNATIGAGANGRTNNYILGSQGGNQTFNGTIVDGGSPTRLQKEGGGTFTLTSTGIRNHSFTGDVVVNAGTFVIGNNAVLVSNGNLRIGNGTLAFAGSGTITGNRTILLSEQGALDVAQVPGGFSTPPTVVVSGTGYVNGAYNHNAGTIAPGGFTNAGTVIFNTAANPSVLTLGAGVLDLDIKAAGSATTNIGGGTNDLIVVNGDIGFNPNAQIRVNYTGITTPTVGQDFPIIFYTGAKTGFAGGVGAISTTSGNVSSAFRSAFSLKDLGNGVIAAHVDSFGGSAQTLRWVGTQSSAWDLNFTKNFQVAGVGTNFFQNDTVVFDNLGSLRPTVTLSNAIYLPNAVIFSNGSNVVNYTINGNGTIAGNTGMLMTGTGTVNVQTGNTFTGNTTISSGWLSQGNFSGVRFGDDVISSPFGLGTVYLGNAVGNATLAINSGGGTVTTANDIRVDAGKTGNFALDNGNANIQSEFKGSGTINIVGTAGNTQWYADNTDFTGTINVLGGSLNMRLGNVKAPGSAFWNIPTGRPITVILNDPSVNEISFAGIAGNGGLNGFASGASVTGDKTFVIGSGNMVSSWNGGISNNSAGSNGNGVNVIQTITSLAKTGTSTLYLTGVNVSFTGDTTVRNGVLQVSNTGGAGGAPVPDGGKLTGTRAVRVQNGGTFRLGTPGGDVSNSGTITTAATRLLLTVDQGGVIDVANAYDADGVPINPEDPENSPLAFSSFKTAPGVTWAGNGGTVIGTIRHEAGTISPGRDTGSGAIGTLNFSDTLRMYGGAVTMDVGSTSLSRDFLSAGTLDIAAGTVVVNVIGNSIAANQSYTLMSSPNILLTNPSGFTGLIVNGRGASGTLVTNANTVSLKMLSAATSAQVTWNGAAGGTWDNKGAQSWVNHLNTPDYFYNGDTVSFTDTGAGTINLGANLTPGGQVRIDNSSSTYTFQGTGKITGSASLRKSGTGTLVILTDNDYTGGTIIDSGTIAIGKDGRNDANGSYSPNTTAGNAAIFNTNKSGSLGSGSIVNNGALVFRRSDGMVMTQNISGSGAVYLTDFGVVELRGTNTYTGGTTVSWGTLKLGHDNALSTTGSITLLGTTNFTGGANFNPTGRGGRIDLNGFAQTIDELNAYGDGAALGDGAPRDAYIQNLATLISNISTLTINRTGTLGFNSGIHNGAEGNGNPVGEIALVKQSSGVATMNYTTAGTISTNYSGRTTINGGTLLVNGSHTPAGTNRGTYTVNTGGALGGDGGISAQIFAQPGSIIAPGSPGDADFGTLNVSSLTMNSANLNFQLTGSNTDNLNVNAANGWILSGVNSVNLTVVGSLNAGTFTLVNYNGANLSNLLSNVALGSITNGSTFNFSLNSNVQQSSLELVVTQPIVTATWQTDNNGTWGTAVNWTSNPTTPNAYGSTANFGSISAPRTVNMDGPFSIGTANFTSASAFTIAGSSITTLTLGNTVLGSGVGINVSAGNHSINVPLVFNNDGTINVSAGATLNLSGGFGLNANGAFSGHNVTKIGTGTLVADNIRNTFGNNGSALLNITQGTVRMSLKPTAGAAEGTTKVNSLAIAGGGAARLDLTNNSMVLDYAAALGGDGSAILAQLRGWLNSSDARLYSSAVDATKGLGYKDNSDITGAGNRGVSNFGGVTVDGSSILVKYTYLGDTNVDGQVDISDIYNLASNYNPNHTGSAVSVWQKGDFNYDGWVDLQDLTKLATNWQAGVGNPLGSGLGAGLGPILASLGLPQVAVPEPTTLGLVGIGLTGLMARRRRRAN